MLSFIIIGRNEGWKLTKCLKSIFKTIEVNNITDYEVIYVDSKSTDDSIDRAKKTDTIKIFQLTGEFNAAIARNLGVEKSKGDVLFFIDGDMEIVPEFLPLVYNEKDGLIYPFVSGQLNNYNYNEKGVFINNTWQYNNVLDSDKYYATTGGIFLMKSDLWLKVGGMDNRFKRGQDLELALRLAKQGYKILRKKEIIANHYTISYTHQSRLWKTLFTGDISYSNAFLFRKHILNKYIYKRIISTNYTTIALIISVLMVFPPHLEWIQYFYFFFILIKVFKNKKSKIIENIELFFFYIVRDVLVVIYFLFIPIPKLKMKEIKYVVAND